MPERACVPIPKQVPFDVAALVGCAVTTGVGAVWNTAGVRPGDRVAVIGCGGVGLSALMAAVAVGAEPVIAVDTTRRKVDAAKAFGATAGVVWAGQRRGHGRGDPRGLAAGASTTRSRRPVAARRCSPPCSRPATAAPPS